jgi:hypothetical protein
MRKLALVTITLALVCPGFAAVPDWVRTAAGAQLPKYEPDTNAVVLFDEVTIRVTSPDEYVEHYRRAVKILRPDGRHEADFATYIRDKEKVLAIHAWSIDRTGREYEVKDKEFAERGGFGDYELYSDIRLRSTTAPAADPGTVVAFEFEVKRRPFPESPRLGVPGIHPGARMSRGFAASARVGVPNLVGRRTSIGPGGICRSRGMDAA